MKSRTKKKLVYKGNTLAGLLFEQEDLFTDEPAEEEGGDETAGDEEEGAEEEEEEKLDVDLDDEVKLSKSIDQDLEALLIDFETDARKSVEIEEEPVVEESFHLGMLLEQEDFEQEIDLERFTSEVARLVKNYTTLLDMEKMLVSKAREFVATRYGAEAEQSLVDTLDAKHDITIEDPDSAEDVPTNSTPVAVGAGAGATGGAA